MRQAVQILAALSLCAGLGLAVGAGGNQADALIAKAVKAHFPGGLDTKNKGMRSKNKGTLQVAGLELEFTQEISVQAPKFKEVMELTVMNKTVKVTTVYNGKDAWIRADDKDVPINDDILAEFKEAAYTMSLMEGVFTKDKDVKFSVVGEVQVKGKPAIGLTVSREGKKDIGLFFDKATGLIAKVEMRKRDLMSGQELTEERFVTEYQEKEGRMIAKKVELFRDGKEFLKADVLEVQILEKLEDSEFARPN
jgi:hypothetical protein